MTSNWDRRTVLKTVGSTGALLAAGVGSAAAKGKPDDAGGRGDDTIVDVAVAADGFDVLVAAVQEAGLVDTLSGNRQLTVFAPTDRAFNDAGITVDNVDEVDDEFLFDVLTYHVTPGRRDAESVTTSDELPTLNGALIDVDGTDLNGNQADIVDTNIDASNGIIHVINGVLLP
jgi:uncharacterized surface protein with fasciclin (FAS1) repeats